MNPLVVAPLAIGAAGIAAHTASKISGASFGQLLSLGEKPVAPAAQTEADENQSTSALDSLFASSGQLSGDSVEELSSATDKLVQEIEAAIRQLLNDEGINPSSEFQLTINDRGEIEVDGAGTADDALAKLINGDASLANKIRQAAANRSLLETAAEHQDFSAAAGQESQTSIDAYQALFGEKKDGRPQFTFRTDEGLSLDLA
ncbi:hypothetical protein LOC68_04465 [Blastopirellula sp. JC732]|uniref:Uncharacterized protein n=1 Tax=Blastopirellula sediminis TaxID=2894196 RepID=A0A9X1MIZ5_9BACT|nr:hypothetical protein [Blastopirellula sediminis]MCC9609588.1 hypothetical protein [Blastopirellula sediminis]MCC9627636.1 hypothetical protein [Blastopirellula sediminis]